MIVSDSTTLIILSNLNKFSYLRNLFEKIYIPKGVSDEVNHKDFDLPPFIKVLHVKKDETYKALSLLLDKGEREAVALSLQKHLPLIIPKYAIENAN